jgi:hypothetical protein
MHQWERTGSWSGLLGNICPSSSMVHHSVAFASFYPNAPQNLAGQLHFCVSAGRPGCPCIYEGATGLVCEFFWCSTAASQSQTPGYSQFLVSQKEFIWLQAGSKELVLAAL